MIICITETFFHTSFLHEKLKDEDILWIVRNARNLDKSTLTNVHAELTKRARITDDDVALLKKAYGGLSQAEIYLAKKYGVPQSHALSSAYLVDTKTLSERFLDTHREQISKHSPDGAMVFLDIMLKPCWLGFFNNKIINAHSAVLPFARGMHAIEQIAALESPEALENAAGATIHYIDAGIDTGPIIRSEKISHLWEQESIWAIKGESYLLAFQLMYDYLSKENTFTLTDALLHQNQQPGPLFMRKDFTSEKQEISEQRFLNMKEEAIHAGC
ncbi:hypothetical protein AU500_09850 [Lonsdalea populi]|uniref:Uncharacterized protein n=3 Tax=Pectobacteriaceae TaxID=1903410 RepID=A0ACD1JAQ8_9GAMM|nr:hypothetical protein AU499_15130 [Lonsdalea populi]RAT11833.1 hypothetical protein AU485_13485 [Lonsdalea quercina]RAT21618.1 hypothetical protein AU487_05210 [Lonsdalea populi]RAT22382.1 hypothetical protein AU489_12980 [Lonsdalea populi]RAT27758.1 hypothetical protein AU488_01325 [Lonsdalea populi]